MMHYVVTWEGYSRFLDQHVKKHVPPTVTVIYVEEVFNGLNTIDLKKWLDISTSSENIWGRIHSKCVSI